MAICKSCTNESYTLLSTEAYRCLVLLGLIATFRLCVYRFVRFVSKISANLLKLTKHRGFNRNKIIDLFEFLQKSTWIDSS